MLIISQKKNKITKSELYISELYIFLLYLYTLFSFSNEKKIFFSLDFWHPSVDPQQRPPGDVAVSHGLNQLMDMKRADWRNGGQTKWWQVRSKLGLPKWDIIHEIYMIWAYMSKYYMCFIEANVKLWQWYGDTTNSNAMKWWIHHRVCSHHGCEEIKRVSNVEIELNRWHRFGFATFFCHHAKAISYRVKNFIDHTDLPNDNRVASSIIYKWIVVHCWFTLPEGIPLAVWMRIVPCFARWFVFNCHVWHVNTKIMSLKFIEQMPCNVVNRMDQQWIKP